MLVNCIFVQVLVGVKNEKTLDFHGGVPGSCESNGELI
jgi:hypothetical protein